MKRHVRLGINIDHVATLRNARGENYPQVTEAARIVEKSGADLVTVHVREDRRHINEKDLGDILNTINIPVNLEIGANSEMIKIANEYKPKCICFVPEKRKEITTEGGLNLNHNKPFLKKLINNLKKRKIRISLFIEPNLKDINEARNLNADCIEIHTGKICNLINMNKNFTNELKRIKKAVIEGNKLGLEVHAGHGLTFKSAKILTKVKGIEEFNIGHFLIGESIFEGMSSVIKTFKKILKS